LPHEDPTPHISGLLYTRNIVEQISVKGLGIRDEDRGSRTATSPSASPRCYAPNFRYNRDLLKNLCRIAHECLLEYLRATLDLPDGLPGIVMVKGYGCTPGRIPAR